MSDYFEVITDAVTGEQTIRPYTAEEISAAQKASIPASVTPRQIRLLLLQQGLLATVEAAMDSKDSATQITWKYALEFKRDDPILNDVATTSLGLTPEQIDQMFIAAAQL